MSYPNVGGMAVPRVRLLSWLVLLQIRFGPLLHKKMRAIISTGKTTSSKLAIQYVSLHLICVLLQCFIARGLPWSVLVIFFFTTNPLHESLIRRAMRIFVILGFWKCAVLLLRVQLIMEDMNMNHRWVAKIKFNLSVTIISWCRILRITWTLWTSERRSNLKNCSSR